MPPDKSQQEQDRDDFRRDVREDLQRILHTLEGNGQPGLKVRVDRLERSERWRNRVEWAFVVTVVVALTGMLLKAILKP